VNPRTKRPFIWHMFHARPGGGATVAGDGWETAGEGQAAGGIKFGSIEVAEARFPLTFEHHEFRAGSGGDGEHRGGVGAVLRLRVDTTEPAVANTAGDGVRHPPYGLLGGKDGLPHRYRLISRGRTRVLRTKEVGIPVRPGDVFIVESSGGGGYGPPSRRPREARRRDLANGLVTRAGRRG
jgi:N-methylhydantoinase B